MDLPTTITPFDTPLGTCWLNNSILHINVKDINRTEDLAREHYSILGGIIKEKSYTLKHIEVCVDCSEGACKVQERELPKLYKGLAIICRKPAEVLLGNVFKRAETPSMPVQLFNTETEATKWLKELRKKEDRLKRK